MDTLNARLYLKDGGTWEITTRSNGGMRKAKATATGAYRTVENRLLKLLKPSVESKKVTVTVDYGQGYSNAIEATENIISALYALTCFMEDYLSPEFMADRNNKYLSLMKEIN